MSITYLTNEGKKVKTIIKSLFFSNGIFVCTKINGEEFNVDKNKFINCK